MTLRCHHTSDSEMQYQGGDGTDQKKRTTADAIDVRQDDACCHQEDDILDGRRVKSGVSGEASHAEHVDNVIHHHCKKSMS